ncbi:MAG: four helix bundle protein [Saprospiraceae bacterium]
MDTTKKITRFEDLAVWQEGMKLAVDIYNLLKECKGRGMKNQMQRSAVSVPSNIAEGFDRRSNKTFIHFLNISNGSIGELRTQLYLAIAIGLISNKTGQHLIKRTNKISVMIYRLIQIRRSWEN